MNERSSLNPDPVVTMGMPVFNGESYVRQAIESLLKQSYRNFELVISDNASTDKTEEICRNFAKIDSRIRYIRQPNNNGATANFNVVLSQARGSMFMWVAHDDGWEENFLELLVTELTKDTALTFAYGRSIFVDAHGEVCGRGLNNFFKYQYMRIDPRNPGFLNAIVYYLDRSPFKIYGLYRTRSLDGLRMKPFLGSARYADNVFLLHYLSWAKAIECPQAIHYYRILPRPPVVYAEVGNFVVPTHFDIELAFLNEFLVVLWRRLGLKSIFLAPAIPLLFLGAFVKPWAIITKHWICAVAWTGIKAKLKSAIGQAKA